MLGPRPRLANDGSHCVRYCTIFSLIGIIHIRAIYVNLSASPSSDEIQVFLLILLTRTIHNTNAHIVSLLTVFDPANTRRTDGVTVGVSRVQVILPQNLSTSPPRSKRKLHSTLFFSSDEYEFQKNQELT